ncbi:MULTISPECIES: TrmB family transcriptional regulator [Halobacteriaceae]|uniref:TrmB family transcriptional regulator n=1 Tax=Halobacteriaceae TaxID=2236 RepID=UPI0009ACDAED|nr:MULTISPECIES: helix-turn-helix domain-containing protein [Halobacteriaceae]MDR5657825.1 helix-turn-helix domain-containing protein [Halodesulfurarchaeum sp. HSR-GB]
MEQLGDELGRLGWGKYESTCYHALVKFGEMKASQVAARIDAQPAKVYQPLNSLHEQGYVKVRGENPKRYVAQNPRHVIEKERERFEAESDEILESLEEAWEVQIERGPDADDSAWVLSGQDGMNTELRNLIEDAEDSIIGFDTRLAWATRDVIEAIEEALENDIDVNIIGTPHSSDTLDRLEESGATTNIDDNHNRSSYYVVDEKRVLLNIGTQDATLSFEDSDVARIMVDDFQTYAHEEVEAQT